MNRFSISTFIFLGFCLNICLLIFLPDNSNTVKLVIRLTSLAGLIWLIYFFFEYLGTEAEQNQENRGAPDLLINIESLDNSAKSQFDELIKLQVPIYLTGLFTIIIYAYKKENFNIKFGINNIRNRLKEITNYSFFSILSGFGNILVLNVDVLMVSAILGLSATGIYTTAFYIGLIIEIPRRAISQISIPIISENIKNNNFKEIGKNFKLVSLHQLIIGIFLYLLIILNLDNIFNIIPNSENFISGKNIVYIIGLSKLIIMTSGFSSELIMMSKYYKFNVITITILAILSIILNYMLIPQFGMIGAAYASLFSILTFNCIKLIFIKIKIGISPFSNKTIVPIIIGIIIFFIINYFPNNSNPFLDIIKNSLVISSLYIGMIYLLKVSPELNLIIKKIINYQRD